jgi:hypothetical protein
MIETIDTNALFHLLPPEHRDRFLAALKDPDSEETKALLDLATQDQAGSEEESDLDIPDEMPWWEAPEILEEDEDEGIRYADIPDLTSDEAVIGIKPPDGVGLKLAYNALAIWYGLHGIITDFQSGLLPYSPLFSTSIVVISLSDISTHLHCRPTAESHLPNPIPRRSKVYNTIHIRPRSLLSHLGDNRNISRLRSTARASGSAPVPSPDLITPTT